VIKISQVDGSEVFKLHRINGLEITKIKRSAIRGFETTNNKPPVFTGAETRGRPSIY